MRKITVRLIFILAVLLLSWKVPIIVKMETLHLPPGCETVYKTKIQVSDVYWWHIAGEKVIKYDLGYEAAKEYIETHNSKSQLANIEIWEYSGMSDTAVYDSDFDDEFWEQPDRDNYVKIRYFKKI